MPVDINLAFEEPALSGGELNVLVSIAASAPAAVRSIDVSLSGRIRVSVDPSKESDSSSPPFLFERKRLAGATDLGGHLEYRVSFALPADCPPSGIEGLLAIEYELRCDVDVPLWFNSVERRSLVVRSIPEARPARRPASVSSANPKRDGLFVEMWLDDTSFAPGEAITGVYSLGNMGDARLDGSDISLYADFEIAGYPTPHRSLSHSMFRSIASEREGGLIPISLVIPKDRIPSFDLPVGRLAWSVAIAIGRRTARCELPIEIRPFAQSAEKRADTPASIGIVRWRATWSELGAEHGLVLDPSELRLDGGRGGVRIAVAPNGPGLAARLEWESFGIGLSIAPGGLFSRGSVTGDAFSADRFAVSGREAAQVKAAFTTDLRAALLRFEKRTVGDDYAILESPHAVARDSESLSKFLRAVMAAAKAIGRAEDAIPPPAPFEKAAPAWRDLATSSGGRLHLGRLAILGATIEGERLNIETEVGPSGKLTHTRITLALDPPISTPFNPKAEGAAAELVVLANAVIDAARAAVVNARPAQKPGAPWRPPPKVSLRAHGGTMTLTVGKALRDPALLRDAVAQMAILARALRGVIRRGPYR